MMSNFHFIANKFLAIKKEHIEQNPGTINWGRVTLPYPSLCKTLRAMFYIILFIYLFLKTLITERLKFTFLIDYQG